MAEIITKPSDAERNERYVQPFLEVWENAREYRRQAESRWDEAWRLYNNQYDWSRKADWQARNFLAKIPMAVEMGASLIRRAMADANEWFRLEGETHRARLAAPILEKLAYYHLRRQRFIERLPESLKGGLVGSLIVAKVHLALPKGSAAPSTELDAMLRGEYQGPDPEIVISFIDPYNIWLDPTGRDLYVIEREVIDLATAYELADAGILERSALDQIVEDWGKSELDDKAERRRLHQPGGKPTFRREVELLHFWGSLPDPDKEGRGWLIRNGHFVVANQKYLVRKPMDNPYRHGRKPYAIGSPYRRPFSVYHKGMVEDVVGIARAMTELLNLILDATLFSSIRAFEVDVDLIEDPAQLVRGIYPGKVFTKRGTLAPGQRMIQNVEIAPVSDRTMIVYSQLDREFQNGTGITDFMMGLPTARGTPTATQVVRSQSQSMGLMVEVAINLERTFLVPLIELLVSTIAEYHDDFSSETVRNILGSELATELALLAQEDRDAFLAVDAINVRASGISAILNRSEELQKIAQLFQMLANLGPELAGLVLRRLNIDGILKRAVRAFGWNERDILLPEGASPLPPAGLPSQPGQSPPPTPRTAPQATVPGPQPNALEQQMEATIAAIQSAGLM